MNLNTVRTVSLLLAATLAPAAAGETKVKLSKEPLSGEQVAIYAVFLKSYRNGAPGPLNLANRTEPLEISQRDAAGCLAGIELEKPAGSNAIVHALGPDVIRGRADIRLVDPDRQNALIRENDPGRAIRQGKPASEALRAASALGLLRVSEIAFDTRHKYAVLSFSFYCGDLCANGTTLVFEKVGNEWRPTRPRCSAWWS